MSSFEDLFTSLELDVIVPESSLTYPPSPNTDEWLDQLDIIDRKEAFFDEHLQTLFTLRVPQSEPPQDSDIDPPEPSRNLLDFLAHVQILLEASYISPIAPNDDSSEYTVSASPLPSSRLNPNIPSSPPPRTSSIKKPTHLNLSGLLSPNSGFGSASHHPSILPPSTPNPMPASAAVDQRYLQAEGVVLTSRIWGQDVSGSGTGLLDRKDQKDKDSEGTEEEREGFYLLWSKRDRAWIAVYRTVLDIAFLRLNFNSPLLCLTFSATLRDKPLAVASSKSPLAIYLKSVDAISTPPDPMSPTSPSTPVNANNNDNEINPTPETDTEISGPPEINLLAGLYAGPTFAPASSLGRRPPSTNNSTPTGTPTTTTSKVKAGASSESEDDELTLPSTRLGPISRAKLFALPPIEPETPTSSAMITPTPLPGQSALPSAPLSTTGHNRQHTIGGRGKPVLRKSFRKILETASGFKVRMRTVFVPAVLLDEGGEENEEDFEDVELGNEGDSGDEGNGNQDDEEENSENYGEDEDPDRLTSGASERTVVLCVEIETEGDPFYRPADAPDFIVEKVDISITGNAAGGGKEEGATARLIGWDTANALARTGGAKRKKNKKQHSSSESQASFPLYLAPHEQHNLLYAVSFLHSPQEDAALNGIGSMGLAANLTTGVGMNDLPSAGVLGPTGGNKPGGGPDKALQRGVTIEVFGKPCYANSNATITVPAGTGEKSNKYHYPTPTFVSRWNCVLDLSLSQQVPRRRDDFGNDDYDHTPLPTINALPEPPSPFPVPVSANMGLSPSTSAASSNFPASSSFPSIASVVSPNERRALGSLGFGLDLGLGSGSGNRKSSLGLLAFPSASGPATTSMATTEKRHTLPDLPRILPSHVQSAGPGLGYNLGHNLGSTIERPGSALGPSRERRDSAKGGVQGRQRRDSLPISSPGASTSKYTPPSVSAAITAQNLRSPTTYEAPPPPPFKDRGGGGGLSVTIPPSIDQAMGLTPPDAAMNAPPMTPAYPAFPNTTNGAHVALQPHHNAAAAVPPSPLSQGPLIPHGGNLPPNSGNVSGVGYVGPSVEVKRERGMGVGMGFGGGYGGYGGYGGMGSALGSAIPSAIPQTPAPTIGFGTPAPTGRRGGPGTGKAFDGDVQGGGGHDEYGGKIDIDGGNGSQSIVVSVGILPQQNIHPPKTSFESSTPLPSSRPSSRSEFPENPSKGDNLNADTLNFSKHTTSTKPELIYPLSTFILDIFVFNRSTWTRRFEISCPDLRSRRKRREVETLTAASRGPGKRRSENVRAGMMKDLSTRTSDPGVLPLENRVRIGPLLPSACQSVRMKFLAMSPGVHSIDTLTLTDVESGLAMNLRSVMDVVVHEPA
ncbi:TRAPP trafficking subunit Trs65-domain-containing protein [Lentinula edodes]|nr:TRAPP trafficking subunit Trs65-domain-containing protein [Lentinula edodes]